ncbi:hypothetical protein GL50803_0017276 [Giardia duodenalis]|uniref:Uncharacterized protein n=1 Tax=Giardia intestinalis (strain ATCC 50803 / WB clone C6) TaxID=184922 RepID=D3KGB2_GIAIC|nr:hypothetical protein GL50803_0017276 [Giardia intestinalis]KAE8305180.1 hypothetical protein GL50803_0017276 [Giardia intestinalis]
MPRRFIEAATNGLLTAALVYCSLGAGTWVTQTHALRRKIADERGSLPTLMVDEDLLLAKKRVFGQDRVLLAQNMAFWNFLREKSNTHTVCIKQKGIVPTGVLKQLCLSMNLPISTKPNPKTPLCNHIELQHEKSGSCLQGLIGKALSSLRTAQPPGTIVHLRSRAEVQYLPPYYDRLVNGRAGQCIALVDEITELEAANTETADPEYPFYTQGALRLAVSQRLLREPLISMLQDRL